MPEPTTTCSAAATGPPATGYALIVDGQVKREFEVRELAVKAARELKARFPMLQVKVFDAEAHRSETIELTAT
jgi:hypothetical protein